MFQVWNGYFFPSGGPGIYSGFKGPGVRNHSQISINGIPRSFFGLQISPKGVPEVGELEEVRILIGPQTQFFTFEPRLLFGLQIFGKV